MVTALSPSAATEMASRKLDKFIASWNMDTVAQCLGYCRDWNTNAKKAIVVQAVVGSILRCFRISSLKDLPVRPGFLSHFGLSSF